jgi:hypothetical protein
MHDFSMTVNINSNHGYYIKIMCNKNCNDFDLFCLNQYSSFKNACVAQRSD